MAASARSEVIRDGEVGVYHVWARCVRQAFLCGMDPVKGTDYSGRRDWIHAFEKRLAGLYGVEIGFHAEMANHLHLVVRSRPDVIETWSDTDVVRRAKTIYRLVKSQDGATIQEVTDSEIAIEMAKPGRVEELRKRLSRISCFMQSLCEYVARRANREDKTKGTFFEDRFAARCLADEASILVCGIYIDLNQIRAGEALVPEASTHTSAYDRIVAWRARQDGKSAASPRDRWADNWLCKLTIQDGPDVDLDALRHTQSPYRASEKGLLAIDFETYLQLLEATGRMVREDKKGSIPQHLAPILERLQIKTSLWTKLVTKFDQLFGCVVGRSETVAARAAQFGRRWYRGQNLCAEAFG